MIVWLSVTLSLICWSKAQTQHTPLCSYQSEQNCANIDGLRQVGSECSRNGDCQPPAVCANTKCQCPDRFITTIMKQCIQAPTFGQMCIEGKCAPPVLCGPYNYCDRCPTNMQLNNNQCVLGCSTGQVPGVSACLTPVYTIDGTCTEDAQCQVAYSSCINNKCTCAQGMTPSTDKATCVPDTYRCPSGAALLTNNVVTKCKSLTCPHKSGTSWKYDTCPNNYECYIGSWQLSEGCILIQSSQVNQPVVCGICCPTETPWCPMGTPLTGKRCDTSVQSENHDELCPSSTHECYPSYSGKMYCCPKPCPNIQGFSPVVIVNGACYKRAGLQESCIVNEQCVLNGACMNGICACATGYSYTMTDVGTVICAKRCAPNEVSIGGDCFSTSLPGAACDFTVQCVVGNTQCVNGTCQCPCGQTLMFQKCVPMTEARVFIRNSCSVPECRTVTGTSKPALSDTNGFIQCWPAQYSQTYNMCHAFGGYCQPQTPEVYGMMTTGYCCPLPDALCPGYRSPPSPTTNCSLTGLNGCQPGQYCHDFTRMLTGLQFTAVTQGVCCLNSPFLFGTGL